jgi:surface antigen
MARIGLVASAVLALGISGCAEDGRIPNQTIGLVLGTMAGAALGTTVGGQIGSAAGQAAVGVGGTLVGGLIGSSLGARLDKADQEALHRTTQTTLETEPSGVARSWRNPDSGREGTVTAEPAYADDKGRNCRGFSQTAKAGEEVAAERGRACRNADGSWQIVAQ